MTQTSHTPLKRVHSPEMEEENPNSLGSIGRGILDEGKNAASGFASDFFEQLFNTGSDAPKSQEKMLEEYQKQAKESENAKPISKERTTVYSLQEQKEAQEMQEIREMLKQIKEELKAIKRANDAMESELKGAEKLVLEVDPKGGMYNIRFLELILKLLRGVRSKMGESNAWLTTMSSKPKRGSLFATRSKKAGTAYSMSSELSTNRNGQ